VLQLLLDDGYGKKKNIVSEYSMPLSKILWNGTNLGIESGIDFPP
jgi:hypothetical protein